MAETFIFTPAAVEDLEIGYGPYSTIIPDGTTVTLHKIGIQSFLGAAFLNADDQEGATAGDQIDAAVAVLAGGIGVIVLPPTMAAGESSSSIPDATTIIDFRGTAEGLGLRFNLSAAVADGTRSKIYLGDEYDFDASMDFSNSLNVHGTVNDPAGYSIIAGINVQQSIASQSADFTGILIGVLGNASAIATNGSPRTAQSVIGGGFSAAAGGNTIVPELVSIYASAPTNDGGTVTDAIALKVDAVTAVGTRNLSILALGQSELDGAVGIGVVPDSDIGLLVSDNFAHSLQVVGSAQFDSPVGIGANPNPAVGLTIVDPGLIGVSEYGLQVAVVSSVEATSAGVGLIAQCDTAAGSFTQANNYSIYAKNPTKGAGSTITNSYGIYIENMTRGGTANYGLYSAHTGESVFSGRVSGTTHRLTGATPTTGIAANEIGLGRTVITTVGVNGAASALTANPLGYLKINIGGTMAQIPYYNIV